MKIKPKIPISIIFFLPYFAPNRPLGIADRTKLNEKKANENAETLFEKPSSLTAYKVNKASIP
ncbi:hypothetical protein D3C84_1005460 [compost metagenome]